MPPQPPWGPPGSPLSLTGASGKSWSLTFGSPLGASPSQTSVWLVRDNATQRPYAAKRVLCHAGPRATAPEALVDDAAVWRAACLDPGAPVVELVDVQVDRAAGEVVFLSEYCARGHVPRGGKVAEQGVLNLLVALCDAVAAVVRAGRDVGAPAAHGNLVYDSVFVDGEGKVRVGGFGARRVAVLGDNDGLGAGDDLFDVGLLVYSVMFGKAPKEPPFASFPVDVGPYGDALLGILYEILSSGDDPSVPPPSVEQVRSMAIAAGGKPDAVVVTGGPGGGVGAGGGAAAAAGRAGSLGRGPPEEEGAVSEAVERAVDKMVDGVDTGGAYSAILSSLGQNDHVACDAVYAALFRCPVSNDPIVAFRVVAMLHNLMLDGPEEMLACVRRNERFMEWAESSWTREKAKEKSSPGGDASHASAFCFVAGEVAYFAALLRRKAKFHMLAAGAFTGGWARTGAVNEQGRDVIATRRKKVMGGMADLMEMAGELGCLLSKATDAESSVKHAGIRSLVDECGRAHEAALGLAEECSTVESVEKLVPAYDRIWRAGKDLIVSVRNVSAAGGQGWEESFAGDRPREIVAEAELRLQEEVLPDMGELEGLPDGAWNGDESKEEEKARKQEEKAQRKEERKKRKEEKKAAREAEKQAAQDALTAADGAVVVHGAGDEEAAKVKTLFGDLLSLDDRGTAQPQAAAPAAQRPHAGMSDAAALAAAFGAPPRSPGYGAGAGDEESDDGGYDAYQARQEEEIAARNQERREASTGAWAARAGFGSMAVVVSGSGPNAVPGKKYPAFYQCVHDEEAEVQHTGAPGGVAHGETGYGAAEYGRGGGGGAGYNGGGYHQDEDPAGKNGAKMKSNASNRYDEYEGGAYGGDSYDRASDSGGGSYQGEYRSGGSYQSVDYAVGDNEGEKGGHGTYSNGDSLSGDDGYYGQQAKADPGAHTRAGSSRDEPRPASTPTPARCVPQKLVLPPGKVVNLKRIRLGDKIGEGSFGVVYQGEYQRQTVAIKKMHKQLCKNAGTLSEFSQEVALMLSLEHPNLLSCLAACVTPPDVMLVTEFMKRGTLFDVMYKNKIRLTTALVRKIALQMAEGMAYLHSRGIMHCDLKSTNVLLDSGYNVKLGDFGLARDQSGANAAAMGGLSGTVQYLPPECLRGDPHSPKADVYAFGLVVWECVAGEPPYLGIDGMAAARKVLDEGLRPTIPSTCSRPFAAMIRACWAQSPAARPSFNDVISMIKTGGGAK